MKVFKLLIQVLVLIPVITDDAVELKVSGEVLYSYCTEYFGMVNVTFENKSAEWVEVQSVNVSFGNPEYDKNVEIVAGDRLVSWDDSITTKMQSDAFYTRLFLGTLAATSAAISRKNGKEVAGAVALESAGVLTLNELTSTKEKIEIGQVLPRTHLLAGKFSVPPELSTNRWILFNTKEKSDLPYLTQFELKMILNGGKSQTEKVDFRNTENSCSWQSNIRPRNSRRR